MLRLTQLHRLLLACAVVAVAATGFAASAHAGPAPPEIPGPFIHVEEGHKVFLVAHASGVQIYRCEQAHPGFDWKLVAPRADLFDDKGKLIGTHYEGPTWELKDGSFVKATRVDSVVVDATAIPWLLLQKSSTSADGRLASTTFIQRVNTVGGVAPDESGCYGGSQMGDIQEVPYTADYYFWKATGN